VPETISECEKVLKFFPRSYGTYLTLGQFLAKAGDLEGAVPKLQEAAALRPEIPAPHLYLADVYTKLGKQADAERERAEAERLAANPIHPADGAPDPGNAAPQE
jgi:predicted Zn-dependent protease